jgi:monothiol glutaredoxin
MLTRSRTIASRALVGHVRSRVSSIPFVALPSITRSFSIHQKTFAVVDNNDSHDDFKPKKTQHQKLQDKFEEMKKVIDREVNNEPVVLFMKGTPNRPECGFSRAVVQVLENYNIKYKTFNMNEDILMKEALKEYSDWPTIPQLYVKGEFQGGCDIVLGLHRENKLGEILSKSGAEKAQ